MKTESHNTEFDELITTQIEDEISHLQGAKIGRLVEGTIQMPRKKKDKAAILEAYAEYRRDLDRDWYNAYGRIEIEFE